MSTRSRGEPVRTVRELGLPPRAVTALTRAGITDPVALAALTRRELSAIPGLGPGLVAAIRAVVPEPPGPLPAPAPGAGLPEPGRGAADDGSPAAPAIPAFNSLRGPRRPSAVDLLLPGTTPAPSPPPPPPPPATPGRPPDYADLVRLGVHVARSLAVVPARLTRWSVARLRRLLGGPAL